MVTNRDGTDRCILEVDGSAVGVLLREENDSYQFFAAEPEIAVLDRRTFQSPQRAEMEVRRVLRRGERQC